MAQSFSAAHQLSDTPQVRRHVLVTGAGGNIGGYFCEHAGDRYKLRAMIRPGSPEDRKMLEPLAEVVEADVTDLDSMKLACEGIDTVLHLAADPSANATWDELLPANIVGTYNAVVAAKSAGCRRLVFASSIHAISGYPKDVQVKTSDPVNPGDLYGVSKCFGEALSRYMAEKEGLSTVCVRIGAFQPREVMKESVSLLDAFVSQRDLTQLFCRCIDADEIRFAIVHGLSESRFKRMDLSDTREILGYAPQDNFTEINPKLDALDLDEKVLSHSNADEGKSGLREDL